MLTNPRTLLGTKLPALLELFSFFEFLLLTTRHQLFENKIDHSTYFGNNPEYIQGCVCLSSNVLIPSLSSHPLNLPPATPSTTWLISPSEHQGSHASLQPQHAIHPHTGLCSRRMACLLLLVVAIPCLQRQWRLERHFVCQPRQHRSESLVGVFRPR